MHTDKLITSAGTTDENSTNVDGLHVSPACIKPYVMRSLVRSKDFRIGNFVFGVNEYQGTALPICSLHSDNTIRLLVGAKSIGCFHVSEIAPIELEEEWILRFGFKAFPWGWVKKSMQDFGVRLNLRSFSYDVSGNNPVRLKYVHQLQNLYFFLTGEELEVS